MFDSPFSKKELIITVIFAFLVLGILFLINFYNSTTTVVFCDVGQGDGAYLRIKNRIDIMIDAGADRKILDCLGKYMPFYDHSIELAIISHAQQDHFGGYLEIADRYIINKFWMTEVYTENKSFEQLLEKIKNKNITLEFPKSGDVSIFPGAKINFVWPTSEFTNLNSFGSHSKNPLFKQTYRDLNDFSLIFKVGLDKTDILFTGDAGPLILNRLTEQSIIKTVLLKVPHHGSKNGLTSYFLNLADPTVAVISDGKINSYGHPSKEVLDMLEAKNIKIRRTDREGNIVFKIP